MYKLITVFAAVVAGTLLSASVASAKMNKQQTTKCIYSDKNTEAAYQDLQAVYALHLIETKDFLGSIDSAKTCPELKKNLQKLRETSVAQFPANPVRPSSSVGSASGGSPSTPDYRSTGSSTTGGTSGFNPPYNPNSPYPTAPDFYGAPPAESYGYPADDINF